MLLIGFRSTSPHFEKSGSGCCWTGPDGDGPEQQPDAEGADHEEREVGGDVQEVGHAEHRAVVREGVVALGLGDGRQAEDEAQRDDPQGDETQHPCLVSAWRQAFG